MTIRKMKESDFGAVRRIISVCFNIPLGEESDEAAKLSIANDKSLLSRNYYNRFVSEDENGKLTSTLRLVPYKAFFDGNEITVVDIGAVATLPEYRNRGAIRACFGAAFSELYDEGIAFSYVQAFSTAYYKKFGYSPAADLNSWEIKLDKLNSAGVFGSFELIKNDTGALREVYEEMRKRFSLLAERTDDDWAFFKEIYLNEKYTTYLYRDKNGTPKSFFTYQKQSADGKSVLEMKERVYFYDKEGFLAILNFAARSADEFSVLSLDFASDANVASLLPEHARFAVTKKCRSNGTARCINLKSALSAAAFKGDGRAVLEIIDEMIPENSTRFAIEFKGGALTALYKTEEAPDAKMGIDVFTALLLGRYDASDFEFISGLEIYSNAPELEKIFYRKRIATFHCL